MPTSSIQSESTEFKPWNSPHLLTNQFQLLAKFIAALNANLPPEMADAKDEMLTELEFKIINAFSHSMMPSWLALAKSYYPFYKRSDHDNALIEVLEQKLTIKATDYESLSVLIKKVFLTKYPKVNSQYQPFVDNIETVVAKLTAVALSTPALIHDAHQHDKNQFEDSGPSISNCISPIETILHHMLSNAEVDKFVIISAASLLLHVKEIKSHYAQITLIQQLENTQIENKRLQIQLGQEKPGLHVNKLTHNSQVFEEEQNKALQSWQSQQEQRALVSVFKLQKKINQYCSHLREALTKKPTDKQIVEKLAHMTLINNELDKETVLPSQRIKTFEHQLDNANEQLKTHRDPMWIRFLRDCLRILAVTFSGIAIYRKCTDQSLNFFKPSHGQKFMEEANRITTNYYEHLT